MSVSSSDIVAQDESWFEVGEGVDVEVHVDFPAPQPQESLGGAKTNTEPLKSLPALHTGNLSQLS